MHPRILILPVAALVLTGLTIWKMTRPPERRSVEIPAATMRPVSAAMVQPALWDQKSEMVRVQRYVGRHRIFLLFFDGRPFSDPPKPEAVPPRPLCDPMLLEFRDAHARIAATGTIVVAVSDALPTQVRAAQEQLGEFPFPILSDPDHALHRLWNRYDESADKPLPGVFLIDRAGRVAWTETIPLPLPNPADAIRAIIGDD